MFASTKRTRSMLLEGPTELTKPFIFEAAIHWAEAGERVTYITSNPLESLPAVYHDRTDILPETFKLVRFIYPQNYQTLIDKLVHLDDSQALPSVLLMDDLDVYVRDADEMRTAGLLALIRDSANACARIRDSQFHLCIAAKSTSSFIRREYFEEIWQLKLLTRDDREASQLIRLSRMNENGEEGARTDKAFDYQKFHDGALVLKRLSETFVRPEAALGDDKQSLIETSRTSRRVDGSEVYVGAIELS